MSLDAVFDAITNRQVLARFVYVGAVGATVESVVLFAAVQFGDVSTLVAAVSAKEASILLVFVLNDAWTFADVSGTDASYLMRLVESHVIRFLGVVVGLGVLYVLIVYTAVWYVAANLIGIIVGSVSNYVLENVITWETHSRDDT